LEFKFEMKKTKRHRRGATETVAVSRSALISEKTEEAVRQAAFERAWRWYGGPDLDDAKRAKIDAELREGWTLAHKHRKSRRTRAS
jgi:hypothetical protein